MAMECWMSLFPAPHHLPVRWRRLFSRPISVRGMLPPMWRSCLQAVSQSGFLRMMMTAIWSMWMFSLAGDRMWRSSACPAPPGFAGFALIVLKCASPESAGPATKYCLRLHAGSSGFRPLADQLFCSPRFHSDTNPDDAYLPDSHADSAGSDSDSHTTIHPCELW